MLALAHLTWEHGLPAGVHEVHVINRMRMKRAWETILPPMDTPINIKMRNSIITALEIDEWAFRESVSISRRKEESQLFTYNMISTFLLSLSQLYNNFI